MKNNRYRDEWYANKVMNGYPVAVQLLLTDLEKQLEFAAQEQLKNVVTGMGVAFAPTDLWVVIENRMRKAKVSSKYEEHETLPGGGGFFVRKDDVLKAIICPYIDEADKRVKVRVLSKL